MLLELNENEMLTLWKRRHYLEPMRADAAVSRTESYDLDTLAREDMRAWYLRQLHQADARLLKVENIAAEVSAGKRTDRVTAITLPAGTVRVVELKLGGWLTGLGEETPGGWLEGSVCIAEKAAALNRARLPWGGNPFAAPGVSAPQARVAPDGVIEIYGLETQIGMPDIQRLLVIRETAGVYAFDDSLLYNDN